MQFAKADHEAAEDQNIQIRKVLINGSWYKPSFWSLIRPMEEAGPAPAI